jgi:homoserine O-acetyltransferase/O-succinyltransferase
MRHLGQLTALTLPPNAFFRQGVDTFKKIGFDTLDGFVTNFWQRYWLAIDPAGVVYQVNKALAADPSGGGDLQKALGGITAKTLVIGFSGDPMFNPEDGERYASWIPGATFRRIESEFGHLATFSLSQDDVAKVDESLRQLLNS